MRSYKNLDGEEISDIEFYKTNTGILYWNVGDIEYRLNGQTHRMGGPALYVAHVGDDVYQHYCYVFDKNVSKAEHDLLYALLKLKGLLL